MTNQQLNKLSETLDAGGEISPEVQRELVETVRRLHQQETLLIQGILSLQQTSAALLAEFKAAIEVMKRVGERGPNAAPLICTTWGGEYGASWQGGGE